MADDLEQNLQDYLATTGRAAAGLIPLVGGVLAELIGADAYISGNVGNGTPEEMAQWVEYITSDTTSTVGLLSNSISAAVASGSSLPKAIPTTMHSNTQTVR